MKNTHAQKHTDTHRQTHTQAKTITLHLTFSRAVAARFSSASSQAARFSSDSSQVSAKDIEVCFQCRVSHHRRATTSAIEFLNHRDSFPASPLSPRYNQPHSLSKILLEVRCSSVRRIVRHAPRHARLRLRLILQNTHSERAIRRQVNSRFFPSSAA